MIKDVKQRTSFTAIGDIMGKPRQTNSDRWKKRPCVMRYREWCDKVREAAGLPPPKNIGGEIQLTKFDAGNYIGFYMFAHIRIPKSYSKKKRVLLEGMLCIVKPDVDNCIKGFADALFDNDERIRIMQCMKYWCYDDEEPRVDIFLIPSLPNRNE